MARFFAVVFLPLLVFSSVLPAQTTYHLHTETSSTPGLLQLKKAGPDHATVAYQSPNLQGAAAGIYLINEFDTQAGDPGVTGTIPSGTQISFTTWMRKTASLGSVYPAVEIHRNSLSDQPICSTQALAFPLTTTVSQYTFSCATSADVTLTPSDRIYLAMKVDLLSGSSSGAFAGELDIEGTLGGATDSQFTIPAFSTTPKITSLSPTSGASGSSVVVTGTNFGVSQGSSTLTLGSTTVTPQSWGNTFISFLVPSTASTGNVVVKVAGVSSNAIQFKVGPGITTLSPTKGPTGASVTINGTKFGTTVGSVKFSGVAAGITSWTNTKIVATVPTAATTGPVSVTVGTLSSNLVPFNVSSCNVSSISISPAAFNLIIGQGHALQVINNCGQPITSPTWSIANSNIAYISSDTPPQLVAQNAGSTTLMASSQGSTAQAAVNVYTGTDLPLGTALWSSTPAAGSVPASLIPGIPTGSSTPAMFFVEKTSSLQTMVHGMAADGTSLWTTPGPVNSYAVPPLLTDDGGIVITAADSQGITTKIDATGNQVWSYQTNTFATANAIGDDGTIYALEGSRPYYLLAMNGTTGVPKGRSPFPTFNDNLGIFVSNIAIMPNRTAYLVAIYPGGNGLDQQVWLIGLTSSGSPTRQVLHTGFFGINGLPLLIPDGNGGVLAMWSADSNAVVSDVGGTASGTFTTLNGVQQALLGDTGLAYLLGGSKSTGNSSSILAISTSSGTPVWQWDFPAGHFGTLVAPQTGGGVVAVDGSYDVNGFMTQQNVVRLDVNGVANYDTWSAGPGSLTYYANGLWVNGICSLCSTNNQALGMVSASTVSVAETDWINPSGNERRQARPPKNVAFQENTSCSAVDDTTDPAWIMVPMSSSNSGAKVHIRGNTQDVQFVSEDPTIATVTPAAPTGTNTPITISGLKTGQITTIDARSISDSSHNYAQLKVVVKPRLSKTLDMFRIIDPVKNLTPQTVPTSASVQSYLNNTIWGKQANVYFDTVNSPVNVSVHYDLLPAGGDGFMNEIKKDHPDITEAAAIETAVTGMNPNTGTQNRLEMDYVNTIGPAIGDTWSPNYFVDGQAFTGAWVGFVQDTPVLPHNSRENVTAHELGHAMGASHTYKLNDNDPINKSVMYEGLRSTSDPINPCEVRRKAWGKINPTTGDDGTQ